MQDVFVIGRFPPPLDGQTIGTRRLAELLAPSRHVRRIDTSPPDSEHVAAEVKFRPGRVLHYLGQRKQIRDALRQAPQAPVLWASISPAPLGHWRDVLTVLPAFQPEQPVVAVLHRGAFDKLFKSRLTAPTARMLVRRVSAFVFLNRQLSEACAAWIPGEKRFVIPNTIEEQVRCSLGEIASKQENRRSRARLRLLFLSNMMPEKGYWDVLEALRLLRSRSVPVEATFAGGWIAEKDKLDFQAYVAAHALEDSVRHEGPVHDRDHIKRLHLDADVFVLPSYHPTEAQPIALIEALNAGTPLITTYHGGIPEMVSEGREALVVPARDASAIADAVVRLADFPLWLDLSTGARRRFDASFSPEHVRTLWEDLLASYA